MQRQELTAHLHGRRTKAVLRENTTNGRPFIEQKNRQILAVGLAYAGFGDANAHPGDRVQVRWNGGGEMNGHGVSFQKLGR